MKNLSLKDRLNQSRIKSGVKCGLCCLPPKVRAEIDDHFRTGKRDYRIVQEHLKEQGYEFTYSQVSGHAQAGHFNG